MWIEGRYQEFGRELFEPMCAAGESWHVHAPEWFGSERSRRAYLSVLTVFAGPTEEDP
jgi:hypothetical protein